MELENRVGQEMSPQQNLHHVSATTCIASFPMMPQQAMQPALMMQPQPVCPNLAHGQVMTDEQLETLRRQISVYSTICQQLVEMHKAMMAHQSSASGLWLSPSLSFDSSLHPMGHKLTSRQRWTPSQTQLHILERLFEQESGTPNKQRIKEITIELSQHGQISETNVYNWFQNRRARTKRKQQLGGPNNAESELDTDVDMPEEKKGKTEGGLFNDSFNNTHFGEGYTRGSNMEHHQGISEMSPVQENVDCYTALVNQAAFNGHAFDDKQTLTSNDLEASLLAEHKLWDLPWGVSESKVDFGGLSTSEEFYGRRMIMSGAESHH